MKIQLQSKTYEVLGLEGDDLRILHPNTGGPVLINKSQVEVIDNTFPDFWELAHYNGEAYYYPQEFLNVRYFKNLWEVKGILEIENFYETLERLYPQIDTSNRKWIVSGKKTNHILINDDQCVIQISTLY